MKKFILMMTLMFSVLVSANAQTAFETPKFTDNIYVGVGGQVATPTDLNGVFPLNGGVTFLIGKDITPVFGFNVEGTAWFGSHANGGTRARFDRIDAHNVIRGTFVGLNGTVNLTNLFLGYNGTPRKFELQTVTGLGWGHIFTPNADDKSNNDLLAKTGLNFLFNVSKNRAHTIFVQPAVLWNLTNPASNHNNVAFNKMGSQLALSVGYQYHFLTSNGTHSFKIWDVGAMNDEINRLRAELAKKPTEVIKEVVKERVVEKTIQTENMVTVFFSKGSFELTDASKTALDNIGQNAVVDVKGFADEVGPDKFNQTLSEKRANAVAEYLTNRGLKVNSVNAYGETGDIIARVVVVSPTK
jgi:outer membrane protein OmpA-like peptidoglycan-associated protein